jgi:REP element-mobilizing transposase RayT
MLWFCWQIAGRGKSNNRHRGNRMELAKRKHPRLKAFDYSQDGCYFVTICTENKRPILSRVCRGHSPAEDAIICLTAIGHIVEHELLELPNRFPYTIVDKYVIMPTHLHAIIRLENNTYAVSPCPTLMEIICALKSLTTRACNQNDHVTGRKIWQIPFFDKVIRDEKSHHSIWEYIESNPLLWEEDEYNISFA